MDIELTLPNEADIPKEVLNGEFLNNSNFIVTPANKIKYNGSAVRYVSYGAEPAKTAVGTNIVYINLPSTGEYVKYINNGNLTSSVIDTGVKFTRTTDLEIKGRKSGDTSLFGTGSGMCLTGDGGKDFFRVGSNIRCGEHTRLTTTAHTYAIIGNTVRYDNTSVSMTRGSSFDSTNLYVFCRGYSGSSPNDPGTNQDIHYLKIWANGQANGLTNFLLPCWYNVNGTPRAALFDVMTYNMCPLINGIGAKNDKVQIKYNGSLINTNIT